MATRLKLQYLGVEWKLERRKRRRREEWSGDWREKRATRIEDRRRQVRVQEVPGRRKERWRRERKRATGKKRERERERDRAARRDCQRVLRGMLLGERWREAKIDGNKLRS